MYYSTADFDLSLHEANAFLSWDRLLQYLDPANIQTHKATALEGNDCLFEYGNQPDLNDAKIGGLENAKVDKSAAEGLRYLLEEKRRELTGMYGLFTSGKRGTQEFIDAFKESGLLGGTPYVSKELRKQAEEILNHAPKKETKQNIYANKMKEALEKRLADLGVTDFSVSLKDITPRIRALQQDNEIHLREGALFSEEELQGIPLHEIDCHVLLRYLNGKEQECHIFADGTANYPSTEEGFAGYFGFLSENTLRSYGLRVLAVDSMLKENSFVETLSALSEKSNIPIESAYPTVLGVYRGGDGIKGGLPKSHIYLEGILDVKNYVDGGSNPDILCVGRVGIRDIPYIEELLDGGVIERPKYTFKDIAAKQSKVTA